MKAVPSPQTRGLGKVERPKIRLAAVLKLKGEPAGHDNVGHERARRKPAPAPTKAASTATRAAALAPARSTMSPAVAGTPERFLSRHDGDDGALRTEQ